MASAAMTKAVMAKAALATAKAKVATAEAKRLYFGAMGFFFFFWTMDGGPEAQAYQAWQAGGPRANCEVRKPRTGP